MELFEDKIKLRTLYIKAFYIFCLLLALLSDFISDISEIKAFESLLVILGSILPLIGNMKNIILLFIFGTLAFSNYSICFPNYIIFNDNTIFTGLSESTAGYIGLQILLVFVSVVGLFFSQDRCQIRIKSLFNDLVKDNSLFYYYHFLMSIALLCILLWGFTRPEFSGERGSPSTVYEYSSILIIIGLYYSGKRRIIQLSYILISLLYATQNFMFGGRITGLQLIFILLIFFFCNKKISFKFLLLGAVLYITMITIGNMRGQILSGTGVDIANGLQQVFDRGFALDTAYSSYYTSLQFVLTSEFTSEEQRLYMGCLQFLSYIVGGTMLPEANIAQYVSQYYLNYMGGVLPFFGYFCFSWAGVVFYALLTCVYTNVFSRLSVESFNTSHHGFIVCAGIYLGATTFRWYLYSPNNLIRGVMLLGIVYFCSRRILSFKQAGEGL